MKRKISSMTKDERLEFIRATNFTFDVKLITDIHGITEKRIVSYKNEKGMPPVDVSFQNVLRAIDWLETHNFKYK